MSVSIVVPLFNRWDMTAQCLASLAGVDAEIITVDNGSTDETADRDVTIRNRRNRGFAVACNQGARASTGDTIIFLNNDTEPTNGWLESLAMAAQAVGIAGPKLIYADGRIQSSGIWVDFDQPPGLEAVNRTDDHGSPFVHAVTGACLAIRRDLFNDLGAFDTGFWNGYEDVDLCLKARANGFRCLYEPRSVVVHHESQSDRRERFKAVNENVARLRAKWGTS